MLCTIYTDASCDHNTKEGAFAYFAKFGNQTISKAEKIPGTCKNISQAEMYAIFTAVVEVAKIWEGRLKTIVIKTDNAQCIELIKPHEREHKPSDEKEMARKLKRFTKNRNIIVKPLHVKAHSKKTDFNSLINNWCDRMAKDARQRPAQ